eukprot:gnl/Hemi2/4041_TR1410_c0_g1_i1.p1 gnl/Hemi2/4041_TR1410_c0_g1~~gnl/Hemi2/4041_TR1410_c0_g1_i1.p1  ORF type:complete len:248 (+),score=70.58 gnl/Hemi2/4041_TR1410_c0_g1_i1:211-954(+)
MQVERSNNNMWEDPNSSYNNPDEGEGDVLRMFSTMQTSDKEALVTQFQSFVPTAGPDTCVFFLEANDWNLHNALSSFFDYGGSADRVQITPEVAFISDVETDQVVPGHTFTKLWRVQNTGSQAWPNSCSLQFCEGARIYANDSTRVPALLPGQEYEIGVQIVAPRDYGEYAAMFRLSCNEGFPVLFGEPLWAVVTVADNSFGLERLTISSTTAAQQHQQQLAQLQLPEPKREGGPRNSFFAGATMDM